MLFLVPGLEFCGTYKFKLAKIFLRLFVCSRFTHRIGCCSSFLTFSFSFLFFSEKVTPSPKHTHTQTHHTHTLRNASLHQCITTYYAYGLSVTICLNYLKLCFSEKNLLLVCFFLTNQSLINQFIFFFCSFDN